MTLNVELGVKNVILIVSGKGGVGKSFVSAALALALKELGYSVALADMDIHGSSTPSILGLKDVYMGVSMEGSLIPPEVDGLAVVSFEFLLEDKENPIVWRGPLKTRGILELIQKTRWGERDFMVIDTPPGTGDEHLTVIHMLRRWVKGAVLVLTPGELVRRVAERTKRFLNTAGVEILGAVVNMAYYRCSNCGAVHRLLGSPPEIGVKVLAEIPFDPGLAHAINTGKLVNYLHGEGRWILNEFVNLSKTILSLT